MGQPPPPLITARALAPIQPRGTEISNGDRRNEEHKGERITVLRNEMC